MHRVSVADIVARLQQLSAARIDLERVAGIVGDGPLDEDSLRPFVHPRADRYARHLVYRSPLFDVMVLTWMPGQVTPIHNHAGNLGWIRLVRGKMREDRFRLVSGAGACAERVGGRASALDLEVAGDVAPDCRGVRLKPAGTRVFSKTGAVATVDRQRAIHRIGNPRENAKDDLMVTLHVYSRPHDSCLVFDERTGACSRRELKFDNTAVV
ncbi:MAG: hypothetical protein Fur0037_10230 [Planctomycetota bacterium]